MTEPLPPGDRELEQYLRGDSPLSQRYREASRETAPPELDDAILAQARREVRLRPLGINRWLTPIALAASVLLGINLGWNVYKAAPAPGEQRRLDDLMEARKQAVAPAPEQPAAAAPAPAAPAARAEPQASADAATGSAAASREAQPEARRQAEATRALERERAQEADAQAALEKSAAKQESFEPLRREALAGASADRAAAAPAPAAALGEPAKIDHLIDFVGALQGARFIRNGDEHSAAEAAKHLQIKREKAGDRVRTADDFIRLCASHSYVSGEAYLIRFPDGRTRTAEDVLREELARLEGR